MTWKKIPGYPKYEASTSGKIRSSIGSVSVLKPQKLKNGYMQVSLYKGGSQHLERVHELVLTTFKGPKPGPGYEVAHENNDRSDNALSNLSWKTGKENAVDKKQAGHTPKGEKNPSAKISSATAAHIRSLKGKMSVGDIAKKYGLSHSTASRILSGLLWK